MPGTNPEMTIPASAPGETAPLSANTTPVDPPSTVNPVIMDNSRRESIANRNQDPVTVALKQFVNDDRHFSLLRNFRLADLITIFNGVCGSLSIFSSAYFLITLDLDHLKRACLLPIFSLGFDFLDGKVARFRGESSVLGQELDSLADLISFGVAPALVGFTIGLRHPTDVLILTFFVCAGLTRLARFNSTAAFNQRIRAIDEPPQKTGAKNASNSFEGLPIPTSLSLVAAMYESIRRAQIQLPLIYQHLLSDHNSALSINPENSLWLKNVHLNGNQLLGGLVKNSFGIQVHWFSFAFAGWGFLMLSKTFKVPKI
ncbi:CDP-diacylglycerol-serine O-phosphatidyltransferase [Puccinia graminis f. sp. tritici]|uniref:CDP-diacylglycerol-serine O-phosphatidyltransferase n=1 Tax=Puccinia graminis f. sp. tritici TaxID=56615 RepID=A0A5B0SFG6_PUCGR|nr:CDP-diacylglycerol-serine O-phosphatidyltransferase [Puccinia graminis f. sp. tritici]KAA1136542.1 CDP-diacylglycerol-serine O-phosphatidyltransferase [Puccinia graminis f. sp. tritici]